MNNTGLITQQRKFQPSPMKSERKRPYLMSLYSIVKYESLVPNILSSVTAMILKHEFLTWSWRELSENVYFYPPFCGFWTTVY